MRLGLCFFGGLAACLLQVAGLEVLESEMLWQGYHTAWLRAQQGVG